MIGNIILRLCQKSIIHTNTRKKPFLFSFASYCLIRRFASNGVQKMIRNHNNLKLLSEGEVSAFLSHLPRIIEDAAAKEVTLDYAPVKQRLEKLLNYYGPQGKFLRQHVLIYAYKTIEKHYGTFDPKNMEQVHKLAWCLELHNLKLMIVDDILDNHEIRRGIRSWYKQENVGLSVIMDSYLLQTSLFYIMKKYFSSHPCYSKMVECFCRLDIASALLLDWETNSIAKFTHETHSDIAQGKTTYFILGQPFELATLLSNKGAHMNDLFRKVFEYFGFLYTIENDVIDCYGEEFGAKPGTDIQENRITALILAALSKASPGQRKQLEQCYGSKDDDKVDKVKQIYGELDVLGECFKLEERIYHNITEEIKNIQDDFARELIEQLAYIYSFGEIGKPIPCNTSS